jgi:hypothetical protein
MIACTADAEDIDCSTIWAAAGPVLEEPVTVWVVPQVPDEGVISTFVISELRAGAGDGELFEPRTLEEGVCALDRMLGDETRDAVREGLADYLRAPDGASAETKLEEIERFINTRLDRLYVQHGMRPGTGILSIRVHMTPQLGIRRFGGEEAYSPLQREAASLGVTTPNLVLDWVWVEYLDYLSGSDFASDEFIRFAHPVRSGSRRIG